MNIGRRMLECYNNKKWHFAKLTLNFYLVTCLAVRLSSYQSSCLQNIKSRVQLPPEVFFYLQHLLHFSRIDLLSSILSFYILFWGDTVFESLSYKFISLLKVTKTFQKVSWTHRITNTEVSTKTWNLSMELIICQKVSYLGHNPEKSWLANLRTWCDKSSAELFRIATNKIKIAMMIASIRNRIGT